MGAEVFQHGWGLRAVHHNLVLNQSWFCFRLLELIARGLRFIHISSKPLGMSSADSCRPSADKYFVRSRRWLRRRLIAVYMLPYLRWPRDAYPYTIPTVPKKTQKNNSKSECKSQPKCFHTMEMFPRSIFGCVCFTDIAVEMRREWQCFSLIINTAQEPA